MLKELNKLLMTANRQAAAWRRWQRKLPHNRVRRQRIRDANGRTIGYEPPEPISEPIFSSTLCRRIDLPSGRVDVCIAEPNIAAAYRLARYPKPSAAEVQA